MSEPAGIAEQFFPDSSTFRQQGDVFLIGFPAMGVTFEVERLDIGKEIHGFVKVTCAVPTYPAVLHQGRFNFTSTSTRSSLTKYLDGRMPHNEWGNAVEEVVGYVLDHIREGSPVVKITNVAPREMARFRIDPLVVEGFPNIIFGPGGSGKSLIGALCAVGVQGSLKLCDIPFFGGNVLVCDWELDDVTYREVAEKLCRGFNIDLPDFDYRRCMAPLAEEASSIGRHIAREKIDFVVIDSLGYAIGGDKTSQELTMRMFAAIRQWGGVTSLCIDHVTNDEANGNRPYGSVYTVNSARSLWRVRASQEEGSNELEIGLFQTKANFGKQPPVGFRVRFEGDATFIESKDVREMPTEVKGEPSASLKIKTCLLEAREALVRDEIASRTGVPKEQVQARLGEMLRRGDVVKIEPTRGTTYVPKWGLRSLQQEGE